MLAEAIKNIKFNQVVSIFIDGDLEIYLAHTGLLEVGFTFKGKHEESTVKNHFSYKQVREMIKITEEVIYFYHNKNRTIYCDIYNKDSYTPKREKLASLLGFSPLPNGEYFDVKGENIWVFSCTSSSKRKELNFSKLREREFLPEDSFTKLFEDSLVEIWEEQPEADFPMWHILYKQKWYVVFYEDTIKTTSEGDVVSFIYS